ncbi:unnamed protein product [Tenebrio molitor]|nr:unnamed protein product [Tenebrio molitor]
MVAGMSGMAFNVDHLCLRCPRDHPPHQNMLQIFQSLTPADLDVKPTRIWSRETKRKLLPCLWCTGVYSIQWQIHKWFIVEVLRQKIYVKS